MIVAGEPVSINACVYIPLTLTFAVTVGPRTSTPLMVSIFPLTSTIASSASFSSAHENMSWLLDCLLPETFAILLRWTLV